MGNARPPEEPYTEPVDQSPQSLRTLTGTVALIIALVFLILSMATSWWTYHADASLPLGVEGTGDMEFRLSEVSSRVELPGITVSNVTSYEEVGPQDVKGVYDVTYVLALLSVIMLVVAVSAGVLSGMGRVPWTAVVVLGVIAALFIIGTAMYFFFALPPALEGLPLPAWVDLGDVEVPIPEGFAGTKSVTGQGGDIRAAWGPGLAWFLVVIAFLVVLAGTSLFLRPKEPVPAGVFTSEPTIS